MTSACGLQSRMTPFSSVWTKASSAVLTMDCAICSLSTSAWCARFCSVTSRSNRRPLRDRWPAASRNGRALATIYARRPALRIATTSSKSSMFSPRSARASGEIRNRQRRHAVGKETGEISRPGQAVEAAVDTEQPPGRGVGNDDHAVLVGHDDGVADAFDRYSPAGSVWCRVGRPFRRMRRQGSDLRRAMRRHGDQLAAAQASTAAVIWVSGRTAISRTRSPAQAPAATAIAPAANAARPRRPTAPGEDQ